jgi:hypothetical protein
MLIEHTKHKSFTVFVYKHDTYSMYLYQTIDDLETLILRQDYPKSFNEHEVLSIGLSYAEAM